MLQNLIRVGPPQGTMNDLDLGVQKEKKSDFDDHSRSEFKSELDREMKKKDSPHEQKAEKKEAKAETHESKETEQPKEPEKISVKKDKQHQESSQVSKKSSGGTKKKMTKADDAEEPEENVKAMAVKTPDQTMVSKLMASKENEVEIADSEENLATIETDKVANNIQNTSAHLFAALNAGEKQHLLPAAAENAESAKVINIAAQGQAQAPTPQLDVDAQEKFQYLTDTEKSMMAEIDGKLMPKADGDLQAMTEAVQQDPQAAAVLQELSEKTGIKKEDLQAMLVQAKQAQAQPQQDAAGVQAQVLPQQFEDKVFNILNKENAKAKLVTQDVKQGPQGVANVLTPAALMAKAKSGNKENFEGQNQNGASADGNPSQGLPKFDGSNDLAAQVSALHTGQRSFANHMNALQGGAALGATAKPDAGADHIKDPNVREIMNQAKFLVTKGGGEMTVKMSPEGMGEVQLKVMLDNGKINIEMNSQDKSVKKLIEDSLSDLKSSLAAHQMRVDHVKINNVSAVDTNNQANAQSDLNHSNSNSNQQNRQHQQEMNFQNMVANSNSERGSSSNTSAPSQVVTNSQPRTQVAPAKPNGYATANKGSSINMIA